MEKLKLCRKCGGQLPPRSAGAGRPASYCSTACRRAAEYELRRVQAAIETAEKRILQHREHLAQSSPYYGTGCCARDGVQEHLHWLDGERVRLEERMKELCDD